MDGWMNEKMDFARDGIQGKGERWMQVTKTWTIATTYACILSYKTQPVFKKTDVFYTKKGKPRKAHGVLTLGWVKAT